MRISPYLLTIIVSWIIAQGAKYLVVAIKNRSLANFRQLYLSGNMPSAHSATVVALLTVIGFKDGVSSGLFGLAAIFTAVVLYDAVMVRRSSGEQGESLTHLIKEQKSSVRLPRVAKGHTPLEVVVGSVVGLVVGVLVAFCYALI